MCRNHSQPCLPLARSLPGAWPGSRLLTAHDGRRRPPRGTPLHTRQNLRLRFLSPPCLSCQPSLLAKKGSRLHSGNDLRSRKQNTRGPGSPLRKRQRQVEVLTSHGRQLRLIVDLQGPISPSWGGKVTLFSFPHPVPHVKEELGFKKGEV